MPAPGASTVSALVVSVASLSGWCLWQRNCVEDALVHDGQVTGAMVQTQASQFGNHSLKAASMIINEHCSKEVFPSGIEYSLSSSHAGLDKVLETSDVANSSLGKYPSKFSGLENIVSPLDMSIEKIVSPFSVALQTEEHSSRVSIGSIVSPLDMNVRAVRGDQLQTSQGDAIVGNIHVHEQAAFTRLSSLMYLLGVAVAFDLAWALPYVAWFGACCVAARHCRSKPSDTSFVKEDTRFAKRPLVKPVFFQARAPSDLEDPEPIFHMSPTCGRSDEFLAGVPASATGAAHCSPSSDHELQAKINAIVDSHTEHRMQCEEHILQVHVNMVLSAAQERQQNRPTDWGEQPNPSPAKSLSNIELAYCANAAIAAAKDRATPASSPAPSPEKSVSDFELGFRAHVALAAAKERTTPSKSLALHASPSPAKSVSDFELSHSAHVALAAAKERTPAHSPAPSPAKSLSDFELSSCAHVALAAAKERTPAPSPAPSPAKSLSDFELSYCAHVALAAAKERTPAHSPAPSPAKSVSDFELSYCAHVALAAAKERTTPAKSPVLFSAHVDAYHEADVAPCQLNMDAYHEDALVPCQLNFAEDADIRVSQKNDQSTPTAVNVEELATEPSEEAVAAVLAKAAAAELASCLSESARVVATLSIEVASEEASDDAKKAQACPLDVTKIPSPTRNRARKQQIFAAASSIADSGNSELTTKSQSPHNVLHSEGTWSANVVDSWFREFVEPEASLPDVNIDCTKSPSMACVAKHEEAQATCMEDSGASAKEGFLVSRSEDPTAWRPKRKCFSSPGDKGAAYRMLQCSATPPAGEKMSVHGRRGLRRGVANQEQDAASPEPVPSTEFFKYQ